MRLKEFFVAACCMASMSVLAAPSATIAGPETALPETTLTRQGQAVKLDLSLPLYLAVEKAPKTEAKLKEIFAKRGFNLANEPGPGVTTLKIGGALDVRMIKMRARIFGLDEFVDNEDTLKAGIDPQNMYAKGQLAATSSAATNTVLVAAGALNLASAIANFGTALGDATGIGGKFNSMLTGDPRGICIWPCDDWNKYHQTVLLVVESTSPDGSTTKSAIKVFTKDEKLFPYQLLSAALGTLSADLFGDPMPAVFNKVAVAE